MLQLICLSNIAFPALCCLRIAIIHYAKVAMRLNPLLVQRDIPMPLVSSGVEKGNLRELALARMGDLGLHCRDVRTREAGIQDIHHKVSCGKLPQLLVKHRR